MIRSRVRVIFDCNVVLQAIFNRRGPSRACVRLVAQGRVTAVLSPQIISELREVLSRDFVHEKRPDVTQAEVDEVLASLIYRAEVVYHVPAVLVFPRDPKDEPYLNLCIAAQPDVLVTRDNDLLDLTSGHSIEAKQFRQLTRNQLEVLDPVTFLNQFTI